MKVLLVAFTSTLASIGKAGQGPRSLAVASLQQPRWRRLGRGKGPTQPSQKPSRSAVFAQIHPEGSRLTELAHGANITPQAMGELVDELEELGYVERNPDPTDRRAKLITLTARGRACIAAGIATIQDIEERIDTILGAEGHVQLRHLLSELLQAP